MAEPARSESAAAQDPARPGGTHDPGAADAWRALIADSALAAQVVAELGRDPGNGAALAMASLVAEALDAAREIARRCTIDDAGAAARERRAYDQGVADCKAARCRLQAVDDG